MSAFTGFVAGAAVVTIVSPWSPPAWFTVALAVGLFVACAHALRKE